MCLVILCMSLLVFPLLIGFAERQETGVWCKMRQGEKELLQQAVPTMCSTRLWSIGLSPSLSLLYFMCVVFFLHECLLTTCMSDVLMS